MVKKAKEELKNIKVKKATYRRLVMCKANAELQLDGERTLSMDAVINALLDGAPEVQLEWKVTESENQKK